MKNRIELHSQMKAFYSIVFNGEHDIRPTHISLYMFLLNQNNRNMWVTWFKCPYDLAMQGAGIQSKTTYYSILDDLVRFGLIEYIKGINLFKAPKIKIKVLTVSKNDTLSDIVTVPLSDTLTDTVTDMLSNTLTGTLSGNIIKLITDNYTLITKHYKLFSDFILSLSEIKEESIGEYQEETEKFENEFEVFRKMYPGTKKGLSTEFVNFKKRHKDWKTIIPILTDRLKQQISAKEQNRVNGAFVPEWKNLQTYINQRDWEAEIPIAEPKLNGSPRETYTPKIPTIE